MGKVVIITGTSNGLGRALADCALTKTDAMVVSISRTISDDHQRFIPNRLNHLALDLSNSISEKALVPLLNWIHPESEVYFVNNAAVIIPIKPIGAFTVDEMNNSIHVNTLGAVSVINFLFKGFPTQPLSLINISSGAATKPIENWALYCSAKSYMKMFFDVVKAENAGNQRISCYEFDPGTLDTPMQRQIRESAAPSQSYFQSLQSDGKLISPEAAATDIFKKVGFLK